MSQKAPKLNSTEEEKTEIENEKKAYFKQYYANHKDNLLGRYKENQRNSRIILNELLELYQSGLLRKVETNSELPCHKFTLNSESLLKEKNKPGPKKGCKRQKNEEVELIFID